MIKKITLLITSLIILLIASGCSQHRRQPAQVQSHHQAQPNSQQQHSRSDQQKTRNRPTPRQSTSQRQVRQPSQTRSRSSVQKKPTSNNKVSPLPRHSTPRSSHARNRIVNMAKNTIGTRYKYGGNNPRSGFDCSGLMSYVHQQGLGLNIPRTAAAQRDKSRTISYAQLKPGDLLFFKTGKRSNHAGIYIGNRQFIHASTGKRQVMVAKMDSKYWHSRFVKFGTFFKK